jgi:hypothetical protein
MGLLSTLLDKVFSGAKAPTTAPEPDSAANIPTSAPGATVSDQGTRPPVDVTAILDELAAKNSEKLEWRKSIIDLMKLVGMDSSLAARKELAAELNYPGDASDSAKMNLWLHKEVIKTLAQNGGKVPAELLD